MNKGRMLALTAFSIEKTVYIGKLLRIHRALYYIIYKIISDENNEMLLKN